MIRLPITNYGLNKNRLRSYWNCLLKLPKVFWKHRVNHNLWHTWKTQAFDRNDGDARTRSPIIWDWIRFRDWIFMHNWVALHWAKAMYIFVMSGLFKCKLQSWAVYLATSYMLFHLFFAKFAQIHKMSLDWHWILKNEVSKWLLLYGNELSAYKAIREKKLFKINKWTNEISCYLNV